VLAAHDGQARESRLQGIGGSALVIPTGYSFNLDGTWHLSHDGGDLSSRQATNTELTLLQQLGIIGILLLTSKGAAGVTGSGSSCSPPRFQASARSRLPASRLILGVDPFHVRGGGALTNLVGNGVGYHRGLEMGGTRLTNDGCRSTSSKRWSLEAEEPEAGHGPRAFRNCGETRHECAAAKTCARLLPRLLCDAGGARPPSPTGRISSASARPRRAAPTTSMARRWRRFSPAPSISRFERLATEGPRAEHRG